MRADWLAGALNLPRSRRHEGCTKTPDSASEHCFMTMADKERSVCPLDKQGNEENLTFEEAFAPLAHHLFPDGCPQLEYQHEDEDDDDTTDAPDLSSIWPSRQDRTAVSHRDAIASIQQLSKHSQHHGLTALQMWCVSLAARETLPRHHETGGGGATGSALVTDGTSKHFCNLIRCLVPCQEERSISSALIMHLLSLKCGGEGQATVLRFLTLALRSGCIVGRARETLSDLYGVIFSRLPDPVCCLDAVRLLHAMTRRRHVRADRARKLRSWYDRSVMDDDRTAVDDLTTGDSSKPADTSKLSSIWLLLQLYARFDPSGCASFFPTYRRMASSSSAWSRCFQIPDKKWEQAFNCLHGSIDSRQQERPSKRARLSNDKNIVDSLAWLNNAFDGIHSFSGDVSRSRQHSVQASDLLSDDSLQQLLVLASDETKSSRQSSVAQTELVRVQACLPYMLHEEWFYRIPSGHADDRGGIEQRANSGASAESSEEPDESSETERDNNKQASISAVTMTTLSSRHRRIQKQNLKEDNPRIRLLKAMASMASHSDSLLPELEAFLVEEILPSWGGTDQMGLLICRDLLPKLSPRSFMELKSSVLRHLAPLFLYGSPRTQYAIVGRGLSGLVHRWCRLDWSTAVVLSKKKQDEGIDVVHLKRSMLQDLVKWTDQLVLKASLVNDAHELLRQAALSFFEVVAETCSDNEASVFLGIPSPALIYRCLLSSSALSVDRACRLLVKYKPIVQQLKAENEFDPRVGVFNCFLWDFCSVLWRCSALPALDDSSTNPARHNSILFTEISPELLRGFHLDEESSKALSVTHGATFAGHAADFCEKHRLSSPDAILGRVKVKYLDFLREHHGLDGIYTFLTTFVGSLADREARKQQSRRRQIER